MNDTLTIRLGDKLAHALQEEARETELAKGEIARQALAARLKARGKLTVMKNYFGSIAGASDLSTNKAYGRAGRRPR